MSSLSCRQPHLVEFYFILRYFDYPEPYFQLKTLRVMQQHTHVARSTYTIQSTANIKDRSLVGSPMASKIIAMVRTPPAGTPAAPTLDAVAVTLQTNWCFWLALQHTFPRYSNCKQSLQQGHADRLLPRQTPSCLLMRCNGDRVQLLSRHLQQLPR